jgi:hypothetical protein
MLKACSSTGNYHSQMNLENYKKWCAGKINSELTTNSDIADKTSYHNVLLKRTSSLNSRKLDLMNWLFLMAYHVLMTC